MAKEVEIRTADGQTVVAPFEGRFRISLGGDRYYRLPQYGPETSVPVEQATIFHGRQNAEDHAVACRQQGESGAFVEILA